MKNINPLPKIVQLFCGFGAYQKPFFEQWQRMGLNMHPACLPLHHQPLLLWHLSELKNRGVKKVYLVDPFQEMAGLYNAHNSIRQLDLSFYAEHMEILWVRHPQAVYTLPWTATDSPCGQKRLERLEDYFQLHWQQAPVASPGFIKSNQTSQGVGCKKHRRSFCKKSLLGDRVTLDAESRVVGSVLGHDVSVGSGTHVIGCVVLPQVTLGAHLELVGKLVTPRGIYDPAEHIWVPLGAPWIQTSLRRGHRGFRGLHVS